jgi:hypothetical protein
VKDGQASPWIEREEAQAKAAARKHFGLRHQLWQFLLREHKVRRQRQIFDETTRTWRQV